MALTPGWESLWIVSKTRRQMLPGTWTLGLPVDTAQGIVPSSADKGSHSIFRLLEHSSQSDCSCLLAINCMPIPLIGMMEFTVVREEVSAPGAPSAVQLEGRSERVSTLLIDYIGTRVGICAVYSPIETSQSDSNKEAFYN